MSSIHFNRILYDAIQQFARAKLISFAGAVNQLVEAGCLHKKLLKKPIPRCEECEAMLNFRIRAKHQFWECKICGDIKKNVVY
jgi:Fe2+ or Zn2+ uptake regulation protein